MRCGRLRSKSEKEKRWGGDNHDHPSYLSNRQSFNRNFFVLSCLVRSCLVLSGIVWSCLVLSGLVWSCLVLSGLVWSCLVLSCLVLSCLYLCCVSLCCVFLSCAHTCLTNSRRPFVIETLNFKSSRLRTCPRSNPAK